MKMALSVKANVVCRSQSFGSDHLSEGMERRPRMELTDMVADRTFVSMTVDRNEYNTYEEGSWYLILSLHSSSNASILSSPYFLSRLPLTTEGEGKFSWPILRELPRNRSAMQSYERRILRRETEKFRAQSNSLVQLTSNVRQLLLCSLETSFPRTYYTMDNFFASQRTCDRRGPQ